MTDARLRTVETELLGVVRHEDVDGWEIPGRYLDFLRSGLAEPLLAVVRHNREDVRSLARLLVHVEVQFADEDGRRLAHRGDLAGLARAYSRERRLEEALDCLDTAVGGVAGGRSAGPQTTTCGGRRSRPVDYGGKPQLRSLDGAAPTGFAMDGGADPRRAGAASSAPRPVLRRRRGLGGARGGHWADRRRRLDRGRQASRASAGRSRGRVRGRRAGPATSRSGAGAWAGSTHRSIEPSRSASSDSDAATGRRAVARGSGQLTAAERRGGTSGTRGSGSIDAHVSRTQSRSGSNEQAIVRRSPASAFR